MISQAQPQENNPKHPLPWHLWARFIFSFLVQKKRSFTRDSQEAVATLHPGLAIVGEDNIPARGPLLVTCNHYNRPNFDAWWIALGISAALSLYRAPGSASEVRWVMTAAWTFPDSWLANKVLTPATYWAFERVAKVYGFITMPPMPPAPNELEARARAVLRTVRLAQRLAKEGGMIGLAPEGQDTSSSGRLGEPPEGAGEFVALLVKAGLQVLPAGISEVSGRLRVAFGSVFTPDIPAQREEKDKAVSRQVMAAIENLLPQKE